MDQKENKIDTQDTQRKVWKVRMLKNYPDAVNHVAIGEVIDENNLYVTLKCRTFHFRKPTISQHIFISEKKIRMFPWHTVAYATELPSRFDWRCAKPVLTKDGDILLKNDASEEEHIGLKRGPVWIET